MMQQSDFKVNMMCGTLEKAYGHCQGLKYSNDLLIRAPIVRKSR